MNYSWIFIFYFLFFCNFSKAQNTTEELISSADKPYLKNLYFGLGIIGRYDTGISVGYGQSVYKDFIVRGGVEYFFAHKNKSKLALYIQPEYIFRFGRYTNLNSISKELDKLGLFLGWRINYVFEQDSFATEFKFRISYRIFQDKGIFVEFGKTTYIGMMVNL